MNEPDKPKIDQNLGYFTGKEFGRRAASGGFAKDSDSKRRSVEWISDTGLACDIAALVFRIMLRIIPHGMGSGLLFSWICTGALVAGIILTAVAAIFIVPLYRQDKKRTSGALGTTLAGIAVLIIHFAVMFM